MVLVGSSSALASVRPTRFWRPSDPVLASIYHTATYSYYTVLKHREETYGRSACRYIKSLFSFSYKIQNLTISIEAPPSTKNKQEGYCGNRLWSVSMTTPHAQEGRELWFHIKKK